VLLLGLRYLTLSTLATVLVILVAFFSWRLWQRQRGDHHPPPPPPGSAWRQWSEVVGDVDDRFITTRDGVRLHVMVAGELPPRRGQGTQRTMLIGNGLGGSLDFWEPVLRYFVPRGWRVCSWDYRGLFDSAAPPRQRMLAVPESAKDAAEILDSLGVGVVDVFVGWSTGVQVGLELCALAPDRVAKLVLLNGTHGQVLSTVFQPLFRVPLIADMMATLLELLQANLDLLYRLSVIFFRHPWLMKWFYLRPYSLLVGNADMERLTLNYVHNIFARGPQHTLNYLRTFLELHAHSVFHVLRSIEHPTLIVSGFLDHHTPAYNSFEMASKLKNSQHVCHFAATHFALVEFPAEITEDIAAFVEERAPFARRYRRLSDTRFERVIDTDSDSE